jgi:hypothetical protein
MSAADWFCKIGEKKVGPLTGQQLKTIVAKGQLKPEHLVRRGSEGPWVPAGRIKGLFPESASGAAAGKKLPQATAKPLPKAAKPGAPPAARTAQLPAATESAVPPADIPQEFALGQHHKHHVELNVDGLHIETTPVSVSRRKVKAGLKGMKKDERKKLTIMLMCLIGGGTTFGAIVILWAAMSGKLSSTTHEGPKDPSVAAPPASSGKQPEKAPAESKPAAATGEEPKDPWPKTVTVGPVEVNMIKATRDAPPEGVKTDAAEVLTVQVRLNLTKAGQTVDRTSWMDGKLKKLVSLKDKDKSYELLDERIASKGDGKTISADWLLVNLIFQAPTNEKLKYLHLTLPAAAFQAGSGKIYLQINASDITAAAAKKPAENAEKSDTPGDADSAKDAPKGKAKK